MTQRTTLTAVTDILGNLYVSGASPSVQPFINTATLLVDRVVACALTKGVTITTEEAEQIEAYLAAHFFGHAQQFFTSKSTVSASGSFQGQFAMSLDASQYGQTAKMLDPSGCLAALSKGARAGMTWLGKTGENQIAAVDRGYNT
jgi:hypothetical protein